MVKLTWGQWTVLALASAPMAAAGIAGGIASYFNFTGVLASRSNAISLVLAGEGAAVICALVALSVTLMGQHTPAPARAGLWLIPLAASVAGAFIAPNLNTKVVMGLSPLAMTAAGEGITLVARRVVAFRTGVDIEQQRRSGLLLWHANRAANGSGLGKYLSTAAVWRLTKQFAATDPQMSVQLGEVQRFRIGEGADTNLAAVLSGAASKSPKQPKVDPASLPGLPEQLRSLGLAPLPELTSADNQLITGPVSQSESLRQVAAAPTTIVPSQPATQPLSAPADDSYDFIKGVLAEASQSVATDTTTLLTGAEAAALANVSDGTIRSWASRGKAGKGKLRVADRNANGHSLFLAEDVLNMI